MQNGLKLRLNLSKVFTLLVIFYPLTSVYASPVSSISIGDITIILMIVPMLLDMLCKRKKVRIVPFWAYMLYALVITLLCSALFTFISSSYSMSGAIIRLIRDAFFLIAIVVFGSNYFDYRCGRKALKIFVVILGCFIIFQSLVYKIFGKYVPGIIPQLRTTISGGLSGAEYNKTFKHIADVYGYVRCSGFLSEPAVVGQVVSVALLLELFDFSGKPSKILCPFYSLILALTFSTNSYVALFVCWALWIFWVIFLKHHRVNVTWLILTIFLAATAVAVLLSNENTANVFARFLELKYRVSGSSVIRVLRGMAFYLQMPFFYQIFGSGFGNFLQFKGIYTITTIYECADEYMNMNAYILISSGLVGFLLFIFTIFHTIRDNALVSKMIFILLLVFGLSCSIYSTPQFMIMMMFILFVPKEENKNGIAYYHASQHL